MVAEKLELVEKELEKELKQMKVVFVHFDTGLVYIGRYNEKEKKLYDTLQVIIQPKQTQNQTSVSTGIQIEYHFYPILFGLTKDNIVDLSNANYFIVEPKSEIIDNYEKTITVLKTGIEITNEIKTERKIN
jgi:hypothetical protein